MPECPECRHEHEAKFCPECGTPATGKPKPPARDTAVRKAMRETMTEVLDERAEARRKSRATGRRRRPWYDELAGGDDAAA